MLPNSNDFARLQAELAARATGFATVAEEFIKQGKTDDALRVLGIIKETFGQIPPNASATYRDHFNERVAFIKETELG